MIPFPNKKYEIIYADPPWSYENKTDCGGQRGSFTNHISKQYNTMSFNDIYNLPVKTIADKNCLLFLWVVSPNLIEGIETGKQWGFKYKTIAFIWNKIHLLPGSYTMSQCELCLVFKKGNIPSPRGSRNIKQYFEQSITKKRIRHSEKPHEIRYRIEQLFPQQRKIELFARSKYPEWDVWGDEAPTEENSNLFLL